MIHAAEMATVWVVRGGSRDHLVKTFLDDGVIGLVHETFPDGRTIDRLGALRLLGVGMDDEPTKGQEAEVAQFLSFVRRIEVGDIAVLIDPAPAGLTCGVVTGDYEYDPDVPASRAPHRRRVDWRRRLPFADLPERLAHVPSQRSVLEDVPDGRLRTLAQACCRGEVGEDPFDRPVVARAPRRPAARRSGTPAPKRPTKASRRPRDERRCTVCLVTKPESLFDGGSDQCRDCA